MILIHKIRFRVSDERGVTHLKQKPPLVWACHVIWSWLLLDCTVFLTADDDAPHNGTLTFNIINWRFAKTSDVADNLEHCRFLDGRKLWKRITG